MIFRFGAFSRPGGGFYVHKLFAWPGSGFDLHKLSGPYYSKIVEEFNAPNFDSKITRKRESKTAAIRLQRKLFRPLCGRAAHESNSKLFAGPGHIFSVSSLETLRTGTVLFACILLE